MDDLTLLRELGHEFDPPAAGPALATRERVVAATRGTRRSPRRTAMRWVTPALGAGLAGVLALVLLLPGRPYDGPSAPGAQSRTPVTTGGAVTNGTRLDAAHVLLAAATTARAGAGHPPPGDAFVYTRSLEAEPGRRGERETWYSVDGHRDSVVTPSWSTDLVGIAGCPRSGFVRHHRKGFSSVEPCTAQPAYRADAPRNADEAYRLLMGGGGTTGNAFKQAGELLSENALPPGSVAAVLEALARIPGAGVHEGVRTLSGRSGVAVSIVQQPAPGTTTSTVPPGAEEQAVRYGLIVDSGSHRLLGGWFGDPAEAGPSGYVWEVVTQGIVEQVLLRPDGTERHGKVDTSDM